MRFWFRLWLRLRLGLRCGTGNRRELDASFGKDRPECGNERGGVQPPRGFGKEVPAPAEEEIAQAPVGRVAQPGDRSHDSLLCRSWDPVLLCLAVDYRCDDAARYPSSPADLVAIYS